MYKKIMGAVVLISISSSLLFSASEVQKKSSKTFLTGLAASTALNATLYSGALALLKSEHPYFGAACLAAATASPLLATQFVEQIKGSELTTKEAIQLGVADFFTNLAAGGFMASSCEQGWVNKAFIGVCLAKFAHILWYIGQLPATPEADIDLNHHLPTQAEPTVVHVPQEIKVVTPTVAQPKTTAQVVAPVTPAASNYPWMGGEKPNHHDAFMLLGN